MRLKNIISGILAATIVTATAIPGKAPEETTPQTIETKLLSCADNPSSKCVSEIKSNIEDFLADFIEPEPVIPPRTKSYCGHWRKEKVCYQLSENEYEQVESHRSAKIVEGKNGEKTKSKPALKNYEVVPYLGFVALMRYESLIDFVAEHYGLGQGKILEAMYQESSFQINARGKNNERGLGQKMPNTAKTLINKITNADHPLFYPHLDREDYFDGEDFLFWKLSTDPRLNIVMTAAMIKTAQADLEDVLAGRGMTKEDFAKRVKHAGQEDTFWYLRKKKSKIFEFYNVNNSDRKRINKFWEKNDVEIENLFYIIYNGGSDAIRRLLKTVRKAAAEVLLTNFTAYSRNKETVKRFMSLYEGTDIIENER